MTTTPSGPAYAIESVGNALRILLMLRERRSLRVTDVSNELNVARSTAHRLLATLASLGFVKQDRSSREYRAGRVLIEIGLAAVGDLDVRQKAQPHMELLARELRETVNLIVLEGSGARFIHGVEGDRPIRVSSRTGYLIPAHSTSGGKVLLAELRDEEVRALFPNGLSTVTSHTICQFDQLKTELATVRSHGYALNVSESEVNLHAVAVPIRVGERAVAALAVSTPAQRMGVREIPIFVAALHQAAGGISDDMS
jgi:DNA-binding IclR family transcriptional regulator